MNWFVEWAKAAKDVMTDPKGFYSRIEKKENYIYPIKFAATSGFVASLISFVFLHMQNLMGVEIEPVLLSPLGLVLFLIFGIVGGPLGLFANAAFTHLFVIVFGFEGYQKTTEAFSYPTSISALLGWIPILNLVAFIYMLYVEARALESFHGMSTKLAAVAVVFGVLLPIVLVSVVGIIFALTLDLEVLLGM